MGNEVTNHREEDMRLSLLRTTSIHGHKELGGGMQSKSHGLLYVFINEQASQPVMLSVDFYYRFKVHHVFKGSLKSHSVLHTSIFLKGCPPHPVCLFYIKDSVGVVELSTFPYLARIELKVVQRRLGKAHECRRLPF